MAEKVEGRRPLGISRLRKEHNIKIGLKEIRQSVWIGFIWFRYGQKIGTCENGKNLRFPESVANLTQKELASQEVVFMQLP